MKPHSEVCIEVEREKVWEARLDGLSSDVDDLARLPWDDSAPCS
jgi:hypothetical protein